MCDLPKMDVITIYAVDCCYVLMLAMQYKCTRVTQKFVVV